MAGRWPSLESAVRVWVSAGTGFEEKVRVPVSCQIAQRRGETRPYLGIRKLLTTGITLINLTFRKCASLK